MPQLRSDLVEVFVVRWRNGQLEVLLGQRLSQQPFGSVWQPFSARIDVSEATLEAAEPKGFFQRIAMENKLICPKSSADATLSTCAGRSWLLSVSAASF